MNIPIELIAAAFVAVIGLQAWILGEIVALKVKLARYEELEKRVTKLEERPATS